MDRVIINQKLSELCISEETKQFFARCNISLDAFSFDLDYLRTLFKQNKTLFYHVVNELSLYGCDYHSAKNASFFPQPVGISFRKISSNSNEPLGTSEINELRLWKLFSEYHKRDKKSLNGVCIERLNAFVGERLDESDFAKYGFLIVNNKEESLTNYSSDEIKNIWIPKFYLKFISSLWVCDDNLLNVYKNNGLIYYKDFLSLKEKDAERLVKAIKKSFEDKYEAGVYCFNLCVFLKEKEDFMNALSEANLDFSFILNEQSAYQCNAEILINDYCFFSLKRFDYDLIAFLKINSETGNLYLPSPATQYLKRNGVSDLVSLRKNIFDKEISYYRFDDLNNSIITYNYCPYVIFDFIHNEIEGTCVENEKELDYELRKHSIDYNFSDFKESIISSNGKESKVNSVFSILAMRDQGLTLDEIGKKMFVTRERIRQIVAKFLERNAKHYQNLLSRMFENVDFYSYSQILKMIGLSEFIESKHIKTNIIFNRKLCLAIRENDSKAIDKYINENNKQIGFNIFNSTIHLINQPLNFAGFFLYESRDILFNPYPSFTTIKRATAVDVAYLYLGTKGIKGFDANADIDEARKFFAQYDLDALEINDRALIGRIQRIDYVLVGMSRYARTDFITEDIKKTVKQVMSEYPINKSYGTVAKEIYFAKEKELIAAGIDNYYFLYGVASKWKMCGYTYAGRSMRIFDGIELSLNQIVYRYIRANGPIVSSKKICDDLGMREVGFEQVDFVSKYDPDTYIHTQFIKCSEYQAKKLVDFINKKINQNGYFLAKEILDGELYFDSTFYLFFKENLINNSQSRLGYAVEIVLLRYDYKKYKVSHMIHCVSFASNPIFTTADVAHEHFQDNEFSKEELFDFLDSVELGGEVTRKEFLKNYVVKVGSNGYVVSKEYSIDYKEMNYLCSKLDEFYKEEICITANEALNKMTIYEIKHSFNNNPVGFCSAVTFYGKGNWARPRNNVNYNNTKISILLANKKMFPNNTDITISDVIRKIIMSINKTYMAYNDISEYLLTYEITSSALPYGVFKQIFAEDIEENGLVRIKK